MSLQLVAIEPSDCVQIDLLLQRADHPLNIMQQALYPQSFKAYVVPQLHHAVLRVAKELAQQYGWQLVIHDAWRPYEVQQAMYDKFGHTDMVAPPELGRHVRAAAIDVSVRNQVSGEAVDFGTVVDALVPEAAHDCWHVFQDDAARSHTVRHNRGRLLTAMMDHGLEGIRPEWWHYQLRDVSALKPLRWNDVSL